MRAFSFWRELDRPGTARPALGREFVVEAESFRNLPQAVARYLA